MYRRFLQNHVLANLTFALVIIIGSISYFLLPRQQDPTINFNWIQVTTFFPGASAADVEKRITNPLEDAIRRVQDIRFVNSNSREGISSILVRFDEISERKFDKRVADLRREIQNKERELPDVVNSPDILEVTTSTGFPTAQVAVSGEANDENLRIQARNIRKDLELLDGVSQVYAYGLNDPELQVNFIPEHLQNLGVNPANIADAITANFRDIAAGNIDIGKQNWLVRFVGTDSDPSYLAQLPILTSQGEIQLSGIAEVTRGREEAERLVSVNGKPSILLPIFKTAETNTLNLVERITQYVDQRNRFNSTTGVELILVDDQTELTRNALKVMQTNSILGLLLVLAVTFIFLGAKIAIFTSIAIPFVLCACFWVLFSIGQTLNVIVLLGIVISLGMLVDDAVVVVEAIYYRLQRGASALEASIDALKEVFAPVTTSVLTTISAFLPLMLLPGILGKFMFLVPFIVTLALLASLIEAYWMLPAHIIASDVKLDSESKTQKKRIKFLHLIRVKYTRLLIKAMRYPLRILGTAILLFILSISSIALGLVKFDFFAADPLRLFYVNVTMPAGTTLEVALDKTVEIEKHVRKYIDEDEIRSIVSYSGILFTEIEPVFGDRFGQVVVNLQPQKRGSRSLGDIIDELRENITDLPGPENISFLRLAGGPPTTRPITIKVRGDNFSEIRAAAKKLSEIMQATEGVKDIKIDDTPGQKELILRLNHEAIRQANLNPSTVIRIARLYIDGEVVASMQHDGEELNIRVRAKPTSTDSIKQILREPVALANGSSIPLGELVYASQNTGPDRILHYNFRRAIEVSADIDRSKTDTVTANNTILAEWAAIAKQYPNADLDSSGLIDDIFESLDAMGQLFLFGLLLIYLILGTQFRSYFQPFLILSTVPLAFTGVILSMLVSRSAISLYTLYGVVALAGIAVNSAIVLISTANAKLKRGMSILHATIYAARRRVVPILITSLSTIAGLFSLSIGLGGYSLLWGPMASSIVWGLSFSTLLTLFIIPVLYEFSMSLPNRSFQENYKLMLNTLVKRR